MEIENWDDLPNIKEELLRGIYSYGFEVQVQYKKRLFYLFLIKMMLLHKHNQEQVKQDVLLLAYLI